MSKIENGVPNEHTPLPVPRAAERGGGPAPKRKLWRRLLLLAALLSIYPVFILGYTWSCVLSSDFKGGRHGPLDAYRHALASATVSYTLGEWAVALVSTVFEAKQQDSNRMDRHNNRIGARIGASAAAFRELEPSVRQAVLSGSPDTGDPQQIMWLSETNWRDASLW